MAALYKTHHSQLNFYVCSSLKQQTTGRHVAPTENRQKVKDPQVGLNNKICPLPSHQTDDNGISQYAPSKDRSIHLKKKNSIKP